MMEERFIREGSSARMGVGVISEPRYVAVCKFCGFKSQEYRYAEAAEDRLEEHSSMPEHQNEVVREFAAEFQGWAPRRFLR